MWQDTGVWSDRRFARHLRREGYSHVLVRDRSQLDLVNQPAVEAFFASEKPEYVFLAAAKVGGILANSTHPVEFLRDNLSIELNLVDAAYRHGVTKLECLGTFLHLSQTGTAAHQGRVPADRPA